MYNNLDQMTEDFSDPKALQAGYIREAQRQRGLAKRRQFERDQKIKRMKRPGRKFIVRKAGLSDYDDMYMGSLLTKKAKKLRKKITKAVPFTKQLMPQQVFKTLTKPLLAPVRVIQKKIEKQEAKAKVAKAKQAINKETRKLAAIAQDAKKLELQAQVTEQRRIQDMRKMQLEQRKAAIAQEMIDRSAAAAEPVYEESYAEPVYEEAYAEPVYEEAYAQAPVYEESYAQAPVYEEAYAPPMPPSTYEESDYSAAADYYEPDYEEDPYAYTAPEGDYSEGYGYDEGELSGIGQTFSIDTAIAYIKSKAADLFKQDLVLQKQLATAKNMLSIAQKKGNTQAVSKLSALIVSIEKSLQRQKDLESRVKKMASYVGLSAFPVIIVAIAVPTAVLLVLHYRNISTQQQTLSMIEKGLLTPAEAAALKQQGILPSLAGLGISTSGLLIAGIVGIGGYIMLKKGKF